MLHPLTISTNSVRHASLSLGSSLMYWPVAYQAGRVGDTVLAYFDYRLLQRQRMDQFVSNPDVAIKHSRFRLLPHGAESDQGIGLSDAVLHSLLQDFSVHLLAVDDVDSHGLEYGKYLTLDPGVPSIVPVADEDTHFHPV